MTSALRFRSLRTRNHVTPDMLSSPLPLYKLPVEAKMPRTGCPERLLQLPVRKHIKTAPTLPENILLENITEIFHLSPRLPSEFPQEGEQETVSRSTVYEYYDPELKHAEDVNTLQFNSVFESGNLLRAARVRRYSHREIKYKCKLLFLFHGHFTCIKA